MRLERLTRDVFPRIDAEVTIGKTSRTHRCGRETIPSIERYDRASLQSRHGRVPLLDPIRIMLVDDHPAVRAGCRRFLEHEPGYRVVAEAGSGEDAYNLLESIQPHVVVLDLSAPGEGGLSTLRRMRGRWPELPVLIFTMHDNLSFAVQALRAGAIGYVTKASDPAILVMAVRCAAAGAMTLSPDIADRLIRMSMSALSGPPLNLSAREFDVFRLIAQGQTRAEIGKALRLSVKTVTNYHSLVRQRLGISTDVQLLRIAIESGAVLPLPLGHRD